MTKATYLYLAVISGYYSEKDWQNWADKEILNNDVVDDWIYNVSLICSKEELCTILYEQSLEECYYDYNDDLKEDIIVGYYYMLFEEKKISLYELISMLGDEDDISVASTVHDVQNFYLLFVKLNKNPELLDDSELKIKLKKLLEPYAELAKKQKNELEYHNRKKYS